MLHKPFFLRNRHKTKYFKRCRLLYIWSEMFSESQSSDFLKALCEEL